MRDEGFAGVPWDRQPSTALPRDYRHACGQTLSKSDYAALLQRINEFESRICFGEAKGTK